MSRNGILTVFGSVIGQHKRTAFSASWLLSGILPLILIGSSGCTKKGPRLAPEGTYFLTERITTVTTDGVIGAAPGTEVRVASVDLDGHKVTDGELEFLVTADQLTRDLDLRDKLVAEDLKLRRTAASVIQKTFDAAMADPSPSPVTHRPVTSRADDSGTAEIVTAIETLSRIIAEKESRYQTFAATRRTNDANRQDSFVEWRDANGIVRRQPMQGTRVTSSPEMERLQTEIRGHRSERGRLSRKLREVVHGSPSTTRTNSALAYVNE